ncbi:MAG TPA: molybdenum cofactor guanylyltransferase [Anaerolineales bacterium]|nr:molybdenum cofactor guanylyltransferase [Anaerolineales bacterium]
MVTLAVQAGGLSRRMGTDKGLVLLAGRPLVVHVLDRLKPLADESLVTTNHPEGYAFLGLRMASDAEPGAGALAGLATALEAASGERVILVACDMPFVQPKLVRRLLELAEDHDAVVPRRAGEFEPLLAVYRRRCLEPIREALAAGKNRVISFFPSVRLRPVDEAEWSPLDPAARSFFNVNTPEDVAIAERMLAEDGGSPEAKPPQGDKP